MAYATAGSGGTLVDLMDALRAFALGQGWTIDKWDSTNRLLFMTKGIAAITMGGFINENVTVWSGPSSGGSSASVADHRLRFALNTSNTAALSTYHSHPGSLVTSNTDNDAPMANGLNGPYLAWHFFADATVGDHIHCVVQISAEVYMHFSLGFVDKKGLTHSGVAYVTANPQIYYRRQENWTLNNTSSFNAPEWASIPFAWGNGRVGQPFIQAQHQRSPGIILKNSNAWPAAWNGPLAHLTFVSNKGGLIVGVLDVEQAYRPEQWPASSGNNLSSLLNCVVVAEPTPYSNVVPLFPVPVFKTHYDNALGQPAQRICYVGDFPNVRLCNMTNLTPGQEITVGSDTYMVFPALRQAPWTERYTDPFPTSGQFAVAYKKVA